MFRRMEICNCKVENDEHVVYVFKYYILEDTKEILINESHINVPCYGIEISSERVVDGRTEDIYCDNISVVSSVKDKVINLIEFLKEKEVSPYHIIDIVGEYADEWVRDFENDARFLMDSISPV